MTKNHSPAVPLPGDRIIFERADGRYDVREVSATGEHQSMKGKGSSFEAARDMARGNLETSHRLWVCHHASPNVFGPFSRHPTASRRATAS
jgi:hypothetical protein